MAENLGRYPDNWKEIAQNRKQAVGWVCQGCGKRCRRSGESVNEFIHRYFDGDIWNGRDEDGNGWFDIVEHPERWTLTVAHKNHRPQDCQDDNLIELCKPCHGRMDLSQMALKRRLKRENCAEATQLVLML